MKKIFNIVMIFLLMIPFLTVPLSKVEAKTLRTLKEELEKTKQDLQNNKNEEKLTQDEINSINANIANINATITQIGKDMVTLTEEIKKAEEEIVEKEAQIKEVINFLQVSSGESEYMEYIFGAKDFTDFIYRMAITEQMSDYNDRLIDEANTLIENNKKKQVELNNKEKELNQKQSELSKELQKKQSDLSKIYDVYVDLEDSIKVQETLIDMYENQYHCSLDDDISVCARNALPPDTVFWRPLTSGYISSEFGSRSYWLNGSYVSDFHSGIDIGTPLNTPVYSTANGTVAGLIYRYNCGGNMVIIHHRVNGQNYSSVYMHLNYYTVNVGDQVTKNTIIGYSGGDPAATWWDGCSTGAHLHFSLAYGLVGTNNNNFWGEFYAGMFNPRIKVNFPWGSFWDRTSKY